MPELEKYSRKVDYTYAPGYFPTMEALLKHPEWVRRVLLSEQAKGEIAEKIHALCGEHRIRVEAADRVLRSISQKENCYAAAVVEKHFTMPADRKHVVLHHISDSGNLGTILRTALAFGYRDVILIRPCADVFDPHVIRASMGAAFSLRLSEFDAFSDYADTQKHREYFPFMLDAAGPASEAAASFTGEAYSLIFGNEGSGLPKEFAHIGRPVYIEQSREVDSLNLAVAAAVGMYLFGEAKEHVGNRS